MTSPSPTILIVDDEIQNRKLLEVLLRPEGYLTRTAANGEEALASIAERAPDLILLDVMMPGMNGYQVASRLKANPATSSIPIIIVTAQIDHSSRLAGLDAGAEDFLTKPVERAELWLRVRNLLRLKTLGDFFQNHARILEQEVQARTADLQLFRTAMDTTADAITLVNRTTMRFVEVNATACNMLGYTREEFFQMGPAQMAAATLKQMESAYDAIIAGPATNEWTETPLRRKDGSRIQAEANRHAQRAGADWIIVEVMRDVTERQRAEKKIAKLNRLYATLSGINTAIVRAASPAELFDIVCDVAVKHGRFSMAWVGTVDHAHQTIAPVAHRGLSAEDVTVIRNSTGQFGEDGGRTATAIREKRPIYVNDYDTARTSTPWHAQAVKHGIRGSATLPIKQGGEIVGVLKLYVRERDFFDAEQLALLEEMGADISFALDRFDTEAKQTQAEAALLESGIRFRALIENASDMTAVISRDGIVSYISPSAKRMGGYEPDELLGTNIFELIHPADAALAVSDMSTLLQTPETVHCAERRFRRKDGSWRIIEIVSRNLLADPAVRGIVANVRDITERKEAEQNRQHDAERLRRSLEETIRAVAHTVEMRDPYTAGHQRRVADLAVAIATAMGLPEEQIHGLHLAGTIHDLGKIHIPAEILSKPGKLTDLEFSFIKTHSQTGYDILKDVEFPWPIAQIVLQHHERRDGSGYPQRLKAEQILLEARILAVADVVEAMSSHRPYRAGLGLDAALREIVKFRGTQFEPAVVDACMKLFAEKRFVFST